MGGKVCGWGFSGLRGKGLGWRVEVVGFGV